MSNGPNRNANDSVEVLRSYLDMGAKLGTVILAAFGSLLWLQVNTVMQKISNIEEITTGNERRLAVIESNRYSAMDAVRDSNITAQRIQEFQVWIRDNYPPRYLLDDIIRIKREILELQKAAHIKPQPVEDR